MRKSIKHGVGLSGIKSMLNGEMAKVGFIKHDHYWQNGMCRIYEPRDFDQLVFDPHTGEDYSMSIVDQGIEDLLIKIKTAALANEASRFIFAMGEKKSNEKIGHFTTVVVDKVDNPDTADQPNFKVMVLDSKSDPSSIFSLYGAMAHAYFTVRRYQYFNCNALLFDKLGNVFSYGSEEELPDNDFIIPSYTFERMYYGHQASILDNSCSAFTVKTMVTIAKSDMAQPLQDIVKEDIGVKHKVFRSSNSFLTTDSYSSMEESLNSAAVQKDAMPADEIVDIDDLSLSSSSNEDEFEVMDGEKTVKPFFDK